MGSPNSSHLKLRFEVDQHSMDLKTYSESLLSLSNLLQEINSEFGNATKSPKTLQLQIEAEKPGSVESIIGIVLSNSNAFSIISYEHLKYTLSGLLKILGDVLKLRKHLAGAQPAKTHVTKKGIEVQNNHGTAIVVNAGALNFFVSNPTISASANLLFQALAGNDEVKGIQISDKNKRIFTAKKKDFSATPSSRKHQEIPKLKTKSIPDANLIARAVSFEPDIPYKFVYQGENITCLIKDSEFFQRINDGERFAKGDRFVCQLDINQELDEGLKAYINKSYVIRKIITHQPRPSQERLKLE